LLVLAFRERVARFALGLLAFFIYRSGPSSRIIDYRMSANNDELRRTRAALLCQSVMQSPCLAGYTRETEGVGFEPPVSLFDGLFCGRTKFCFKTAQFIATLCEYWITEIASVRNAVRHCENERKESLSNMSPLPCLATNCLT
jgi:hypothetical protein